MLDPTVPESWPDSRTLELVYHEAIELASCCLALRHTATMNAADVAAAQEALRRQLELTGHDCLSVAEAEPECIAATLPILEVPTSKALLEAART